MRRGHDRAFDERKGEAAMPKRLAFATVALALLLPAAALAHHGWGSYDAAKVLKFDTTLTNVEWRNPHGMAKTNYQGRTWDVVLAPTARMEARGLTQAMLPSGAKVTLEGYPLSDGGAEMRIERITVGGKTVELR
jgi:hypothetical protein